MDNIRKNRKIIIEELDYRLNQKKSEFKFTHINNQTIGADLSQKSKLIQKSKINNSKFENCIFENIIYKDCNFCGSSFFNCNFKNVVFENCSMEKIVFIENNFYNTKFVLSNMKNTIFSRVYMKNIYIQDCDMRSCKIIQSKIEILEFDDEFLTKLNENSFIDEIIIDKNDKKNYARVCKTYKNLSSKFKSNGLANKAGEYYYLSKITENKILRGIDKIKSNIYWMLCGYGEKPTYALVTSIEIVLIFTIMYMFTGLRADGEVINYELIFLKDLPISTLFSDFAKSLYFSIVTFTTVGYGDITPTGFSVFLSGIEMFLGVTMVGVWTATLARKIVR